MGGLFWSIVFVGCFGCIVGLFGVWQKLKLEKREAEEKERHA